VLHNLKESGKRLIFVSNSPFWYVDAGMRYIFGGSWREEWDAVITSKCKFVSYLFLPMVACGCFPITIARYFRSPIARSPLGAGKPNFYTDTSRPFREVCQETRRILFKEVEKFEPGKVYTEGCLNEMMKLMDWSCPPTANGDPDTENRIKSGSHDMATTNVLYIGDSLFADLVDAKREFGWTTAQITPEVGFEMEVQNRPDHAVSQRSIDLLLNALRLLQDELGTGVRSEEDLKVLDTLERMVSLWRDRETGAFGNKFGSVFRARFQVRKRTSNCSCYFVNVSPILTHYYCVHRSILFMRTTQRSPLFLLIPFVDIATYT
jgi:hypothetical protein